MCSVILFLRYNISLVCVHFEGNQEAPAEPALGEGGEENNSAAGSCQLSTDIKGECAITTAALFYL